MKHIRCLFFITLSLCFLFVSTSLFATSRGIRVVSGKGQSLYLYQDYHAVVVGVGDYTEGWPDLPGAVKEAQEVASYLEELGFTVKLVLNPTSDQLKSVLNDVAFRLGREKNRALLLYFAGHGETLELADGTELGYIIPTNCPLKSRSPLEFNDKAVSMRDIEDLALKVRSKHFLVMFDSCFSGSLLNVVRAAPADITEKSAQPVRQFITAGQAGEQVPDKSIFKIVFLDGIKGDADLNHDGYVTGSELGMHLQEKVVNYSKGAQHPQYGKINNPRLDKGDFIFRLGKLQAGDMVGPGKSQPVPKGLIAYYPFNGNANDESEHGNDGIVHGAVLVKDRFGSVNKAYRFDGFDDYIDLGNGINLSNKSFSWAFWIKRDSNTGDFIMSQYAGGDNPNGKALHIGFRWAQKTFTFAFFNPDLNVASSFSRNWEFWAGTYNADINERRVYKNSTLVGRDITTVDYLGEGPFYIGRTVWDQPKDMFGGVIDEVRIFNRPLAPREIEALFRAGS